MPDDFGAFLDITPDPKERKARKPTEARRPMEKGTPPPKRHRVIPAGGSFEEHLLANCRTALLNVGPVEMEVEEDIVAVARDVLSSRVVITDADGREAQVWSIVEKRKRLKHEDVQLFICLKGRVVGKGSVVQLTSTKLEGLETAYAFATILGVLAPYISSQHIQTPEVWGSLLPIVKQWVAERKASS
jgi:hypothetical protein